MSADQSEDSIAADLLDQAVMLTLVSSLPTSPTVRLVSLYTPSLGAGHASTEHCSSSRDPTCDNYNEIQRNTSRNIFTI